MRRALLAAFVLSLLVAPASAFTTIPPGSSVHDDITAVAKHAGWSTGATKALQQAVREPDAQDMKIDPDGDDVVRFDATAAYAPEHHCERLPGTSDADAFDAAVSYIHAQRAEAANHSAAAEPKKAVEALGRALHALQDCYSHSNIVDLGEQQSAFEDVLLHGGAGGAVVGLRLTAFQPGADIPELPAGDSYAHGAFAKDDGTRIAEAKIVMLDGRTKFEAARDLSRMATVAFLQEFVQERSAAERASLMDVKEEDGGLPDEFHVPGPPVVAVVVAVALAALWRRR